ncbi:MAG: hypothetical protein IPL53_06680 [Ignavibacteria bacterium]|nr:hypothetical protein [Ignavibacteria bacterium]
MKKNNSASLEARLKNSKDLVTFRKDYTLYAPTSEDLKTDNYEAFIAEVDTALTPLKHRSGAFLNAGTALSTVFKKVTQTSRNVRAEMDEIKGKDSDQYRQVNNIVKVITGENVIEHSAHKREIMKTLKQGDPQPDFISVSELDNKSKLGNFRSLIQLLKNFDFYVPVDSTITIAALEALESQATASLADYASKESSFLSERSRMIHYFEDKGGLRDRARRAKVHVKRKYGIKSQEYVALSKKKY